MSFEPIIGLEVHVQLNTNTKMFCSCSSNYLDVEPNTYVCNICLGLPGSLPSVNHEAVISAIKLGLSLNCKISRLTKFDRKNYVYPDLMKGYQISQLDFPIAIEGMMKVKNSMRLVAVKQHYHGYWVVGTPHFLVIDIWQIHHI